MVKPAEIKTNEEEVIMKKVLFLTLAAAAVSVISAGVMASTTPKQQFDVNVKVDKFVDFALDTASAGVQKITLQQPSPKDVNWKGEYYTSGVPFKVTSNSHNGILFNIEENVSKSVAKALGSETNPNWAAIWTGNNSGYAVAPGVTISTNDGRIQTSGTFTVGSESYNLVSPYTYKDTLGSSRSVFYQATDTQGITGLGEWVALPCIAGLSLEGRLHYNMFWNSDNQFNWSALKDGDYSGNVFVTVSTAD